MSGAPTLNGKPLNFYSTLSHHLGLLMRLMEMGSVFLHGYLSAADRELVILTVAAACRSPYVFDGHVPIARKYGLAEEQIGILQARVAGGPRWSCHQQSLIAFTDELLANDSVGDDVWNSISYHDDPTRMIELISLIGFYRMLANIANAVLIEPDELQ